MKKQVEKLAKNNRLTTSKLMLKIVENTLKKGQAATTLYDSDIDLIKNTISNFTKQGLKAKHLVVSEMADKDHLVYVPNIWLLEAGDATKMIGVNEGILKRLKIKDYELIDKNHTLMKRALKNYNYRAKKKIYAIEDFTNTIFKRESSNPLILVEKLDPLKLSKFCKKYRDKKVYYLFGSQDVKVNRQVY